MASSLGYVVPRTADDLRQLITDCTAEGAHIEYKSIKLLGLSNEKIFSDLSTDIGAFANAGGGVVVIGMEEEKGSRKPTDLVGTSDKKKNAEWFENGLLTRIAPPIPGLEILEVSLDNNSYCLVVHAPMSYAGPHQSYDKRYYARRQFRRDQMEHYEIEDLRRRVPFGEEYIDLFLKGSDGGIYFQVDNTSSYTLGEVTFDFENIDNRLIAEQWTPELNRPYLEPFSILRPGEKRYFPSGSYEFFRDKVGDLLNVCVEFTLPDGERKIKKFVFSLLDLATSSSEPHPFEKHLKNIEERLNDIAENFQKFNRDFSRVSENAFHPSGVALSASTLDGLKPSASTETRKWPGEFLSVDALSEILSVDADVAVKIKYKLFGYRSLISGKKIKFAEFDIDEELKTRIRERLELPEWME